MTPTSTVARHKRGDTFSVSGRITVTDEGAELPDLTGWIGRSQLRDLRGVLITDLTFEWLDASQRLCRLSAPEGTAAWPLGPADLDIELTSPVGDVISTGTARLEVIRDVTQ